MAEYNDEKTVIVERDTADRSSPIGWIILVLALIILTFFLMAGGREMFNSDNTTDTTDTSDSTDTTIEQSTSPADTIMPDTDDTTAPTDTDTTPAPTPEQ